MSFSVSEALFKLGGYSMATATALAPHVATALESGLPFNLAVLVAKGETVTFKGKVFDMVNGKIAIS